MKDKGRIWKAAKENLATWKGIPIRLSADYLVEIIQSGREWDDIYNVKKEKKLLPKNTLTKLSFRNRGEIKTSQTKPEGVYQHYTYLTKKMLKIILMAEMKECW